MAVEAIIGPTRLFIASGNTSGTAQYTSVKPPVTWSVTVLNDYGLSPGDDTITISPSGFLTVTIASGVQVPPEGIRIDLSIHARRHGGGAGSFDPSGGRPDDHAGPARGGGDLYPPRP